MKVTRPVSSPLSSSATGDGSHHSNPYAAYGYGRALRAGGASARDDAQGGPSGNGTHNPDGSSDSIAVQDIADVLGIPHDEVTNAVGQAIGRLMRRVKTLSEDLVLLQRQREEILRAEGRDPFTGALSRSSFSQIAANEVALVGMDRTLRTFMLCEIVNLDEILQRHGHACKEGVFRHFHQVIGEFIMPPHQVGYLGCNDFIALLFNMDNRDVRQRADAIARRLRQYPYSWRGRGVTITPVFGVHIAQAGETVEDVLVNVDHALRAEKEMQSARLQRIPAGI